MTQASFLLVVHLKALGIPKGEPEYRFHQTRRWRFDWAWPRRKVAVEIDGGAWIGGRHTRALGFSADLEKLNAAAELGWRVYRYTPEMIRNGDAARQLGRVLGPKKRGTDDETN